MTNMVSYNLLFFTQPWEEESDFFLQRGVIVFTHFILEWLKTAGEETLLKLCFLIPH